MSIAKTLLEFLRKWLAERAYMKKKEQTLSKYGWDCKCPGCKGLMHTDDLVEDFQETDMHWHYLCKCGARSSWRLDVPFCPMFDPSFDGRTLAPWPKSLL